MGCSSIERVEWAAGRTECLKLLWTGVVVEVVVMVGVEEVVEVEGNAGKRNTFSSSPVEAPTRGGGWLNESTVEV